MISMQINETVILSNDDKDADSNDDKSHDEDYAVNGSFFVI